MSVEKYKKDIETIPIPTGIQYFILPNSDFSNTNFDIQVYEDGFDSTFDIELLQGYLGKKENVPDTGTLVVEELTPIVDADNKPINEKNISGNFSANGNTLQGDYMVLKLSSSTTTGTGFVYLKAGVRNTNNPQ